MAAKDHLNERLFHGTNAILNVGDVLEPRRTTFAGKLIHATTDLEEAKQYAYSGLIVAKKWNQKTAPIYEVEPVDPDENLVRLPDPEKHRASQKGFRIVGIPHHVSWDD